MKVSYECELNSDELNVLINAVKDAVRFANGIRLEQQNNRVTDAVSDSVDDLSDKVSNLAFEGKTMINKLTSRINSLEGWVNAQKRAEKYCKK